MTLLAKRYATALFLLSQQQGAVDAVAADVQVLHAALAGPAARALLTSPDVGAGERARVLAALGRGRHQLVQNLLGVLQHRRRLEVLFDLGPAFHTLLLADRGEVEGVAESPHALGDAELAALQSLAGRLSGKKVALTVVIRPELLGGVRLRVGNVLYDGSMAATLAQLEQKLMQAAI
ncbi:MAG: ATP synthase F1 subunit delta [Planctomycetes bacterium]|nr:ATP synthase F1 subunit delta [Planctomycetota bacterium]